MLVTEQPLVLQNAVDTVASDAAGAIATFIGKSTVACNSVSDGSALPGTTRDCFGGKRVVRLEYEGYTPMAEKELLKICKKVRNIPPLLFAVPDHLLQAHQKWDLINTAVIHRLGVVPVGESSVVIAASSAHRRWARSFPQGWISDAV